MSFVKKFKNNININKKIEKTTDRVETIIKESDLKTNYFPKGIFLEDIDNSVFINMSDDKFKLVLDDKTVPSFFLTSERWAEFSKTWSFTDQDKNVLFPYIIIKRKDVKPGTYSGVKYTIPNRKPFEYLRVPTFEDGTYGYDVYSVPQPTAVDVTYDIKLFTKYMADSNKFMELILKNFSDRQFYINVDGHYFRVHSEDLNNETSTQELNGDKFYQITNTIKTHAYLIDPKDFIMTKSYKKVSIDYLINNQILKTDKLP